MSPDNKRRIKYFAILVLAVFIGYAIGRNTGNAVRVIDMTKGWDPKIRELLPEDDWMRKAQGVAIGHFGIYAPNKSDARTLRIYAPKLNQYIHINEGYVSVIHPVDI
ncbi:MAG: hypothetical protein HZA22_12930 [Nitrospirae bacterium]|nr:hypothetical protein [Nitrospirota bacterium]